MPGIAHLFIGSLVALILYNFNSEKFTRKHALFIASLFFTVGFLLHKRKPIAQRLAMFLFVLSGILIFPLGFWALLREQEVIALFNSKDQPPLSVQ